MGGRRLPLSFVRFTSNLALRQKLASHSNNILSRQALRLPGIAKCHRFGAGCHLENQRAAIRCASILAGKTLGDR